MERDLEDVFRPHFQNHHRRYNPFPGRRLLKIKHLELNETNGIYGYRSHNCNIIPRELDSTGKKIETDTTLDFLKLHIVLDKSSDITTISSPLHKMMKPNDSPVHDYK
jgi:hypothetical protein